MRALAIVLLCCVAAPLAAMQAVAAIALRDSADPVSLSHLVPAAVGNAVDRLGANVPLSGALRLVLARSALARGDLALATEDAAALPASRDRLALEAGVAAARGDSATAVRDYFAAGDLQGMEEHIDALVRAGRILDAVNVQRAVVDRLAADPTQQDALAQALFDLGRIDQTLAYQYPVGDPRRHAHEVEAVEPYARAVALAPLDERYLLAFANGELNVGDIADAERILERARDADPTSAEPIAGLGDAAFRRGDIAAAQADLARARVLDPTSAAVGTLARKLGR